MFRDAFRILTISLLKAATAKNKEATVSDAKALLDKPISPDEAALSAAAEGFKNQVIRAALQSAPGDDVSEDLRKFVGEISKQNFEGMAPTAALNKVIQKVSPFKKPDGKPDSISKLATEI